jgi:guanine nucleotide-binding protein alpha-1 subunit
MSTTAAASSSPGKHSLSSLLTDDHRRIRMRLSPLLSLEDVLTKKLFFSAPDKNEISVRGGSGWKSYISKVLSSAKSRPATSSGKEADETTTILSACRDDIVLLWQDNVVHQILNNRNARIHEKPGLQVLFRLESNSGT